LFACNENGQLAGSLSGGCVEDDLMEMLNSGKLASAGPQFFSYGITPEETERLGLPCGGHLDIVVEPVQPQHHKDFHHILQQLEQRNSVQRQVDLSTGATEVKNLDDAARLSWDPESKTLTQVYGPQFQLFIIGAGMVSKYLAEMANALNYQVTVCDPREHLIADFDVAQVRCLTLMPDDAVAQYANDPATAIVALTHDPRIDDMGLMEALSTRAFYIGAMGSTRTSAARRLRLKELDLSDAEIDRLHAPIGLDIGSKTPPEIAIAILAEITAIRHKRSLIFSKATEA
jgi:xanthine dehydrogenase accessory factor